MNFKQKLSILSFVFLIFSSPLSFALMTDEFEILKAQQLIKPVNSIEKIKSISDEDPYESFNRVMFDFNMTFNDSIGQYVVKGYNTVLPQPIRTGVDNFFSNLTVPLSSLNSFLQGNVEDGLSNFMRFTINSTFGLLGLLDVATPAGLEHIPEDFGQTLSTWGVWNETHYLVLPFLGPYTTRSLLGNSIQSVYDPVYPMIIDTDVEGRTWLYFGQSFTSYVKVMKIIDDLYNQPDPYVFARESYLQYRTNLIYNGQPPQDDLDDFDFE